MTKADRIRQLIKEGKTNKEIALEVDSYDAYVGRIRKQLKEQDYIHFKVKVHKEHKELLENIDVEVEFMQWLYSRIAK